MTALPGRPDVRAVRRKVLRWYGSQGRDLPWRRTRDPYRILVSEVMLQQTQVPRVTPHYTRFLKQFPTIRALAQASPGRVLRAWQGLGYNRRALWLHAAARSVIQAPGGRFPSTYDELRRLPGVGEYTSRAILCFAFGEHQPVLDVNIRRVISRLLGLPGTDVDTTLAAQMLPPGKAFEWNQALMDIGSLFCTSRQPDCGECPVSAECRSAGRIPAPVRPSAKREPGRHGVPRRIYRGRVLKVLSSSRRVGSHTLARSVGLRVVPGDVRWLRLVTEQLAREGLLRIIERRSGWSAQRIR